MDRNSYKKTYVEILKILKSKKILTKIFMKYNLIYFKRTNIHPENLNKLKEI